MTLLSTGRCCRTSWISSCGVRERRGCCSRRRREDGVRRPVPARPGLQREIHDGLNVAEGWNGDNQVLFYGKGGDIATNRRDEKELSVACLHVPRAAVAYVNTLLVQDVLAEPGWANALTMGKRLALRADAPVS
jgi:hypothetical protein